MYEFDVKKTTKEVVQWIRDFFEENGKGCNAVVAISGGKDSSVTAALCVEALGRDRVYGVLLPQGVQEDIDKSYLLCSHLGIKYSEINIGPAVDAVLKEMAEKMECEIRTTPSIIVSEREESTGE